MLFFVLSLTYLALGDIGFKSFSIGTIHEGDTQQLKIVQESINNLNEEIFYCLMTPSNNNTHIVRDGDSTVGADVIVRSAYGPLAYIQNELRSEWPQGVRTGNIRCPGLQGGFNTCVNGRIAMEVHVIDDNLNEQPQTTAGVAMGDCALLRCVAVTFVYAEDETTKQKNPGEEFLRNQECFKDNDFPTYEPTQQPSVQPTGFPSKSPSTPPTKFPSDQPTLNPSNPPSLTPTAQPIVPFWCSPAGGVCRNTGSYDYVGIPGKMNFQVTNEQQCASECQAISGCTGYDFMERNQANVIVNDCFLFSSSILQVDCGIGLSRPMWALHKCCKRCPNGLSSCGVPLPVD